MNIYTGQVFYPCGIRAEAEKIDWHAWLGRIRLPSTSPASLSALKETSILVTGAGGSIGSALSLRLAAIGPRALTLLDSSEQALFDLGARLEAGEAACGVRMVLGSALDEALLEELFAQRRPGIVFHAAAYKHLPLLEEQPLAAIRNNALGTHTLVQVAGRFGARVVLLSTDKAAAPASILGASKRIAEQIVAAHGGLVLRLVNVLGSRGSVAETFLSRIAEGEPLVVSDPSAERYFVTQAEAVDLLLAAGAEAEAGSLLVPDLDRPHTIVSLARFLLSLAPSDAKPPLVFGRLRNGEKLRETLWSHEETAHPGEIPGTLRILGSSGVAPGWKMAELQAAVVRRDLAETLRLAMELVPSYAPSELLRAQLGCPQQESPRP